MRAGPAAVCPGTVGHRRTSPVEHAFRYPVEYVWIDPADPTDLVRAHPLWSARRPAPVWFRRQDYGVEARGELDTEVRHVAAQALGAAPTGPVRMLTQLRRWGWLFNPLTTYVLWDRADDDPVAVVLEVTNTPWKERHQYGARLIPAEGGFRATFAKRLHVSPFFDEDYDYQLRLRDDAGSGIRVAIDLVARDGTIELATELTVARQQASRSALARSLWRSPLSTLRVSAGIHTQAVRLLRRGVAVVPHPRRRVPT